MKKVQPIQIAHLLPIIDKYLIELLKGLDKSDWESQTIVPKWTVKDIAVHLLDGNTRSLSMLRDSYFGEKPENVNSYQDLVDFLNKLNSDWVIAMRRISPKIIIELLEITGKQYCDYMTSLDPFQKAVFSVTWAGEQESYNWFHIAREYTEKWHHQQQIRYVVGQEALLYEDNLYFPYLDTSMRALPYHYKNISAKPTTTIKIAVQNSSQNEWFLYRDNNDWILLDKIETAEPISEIEIPSNLAWKLFTKGIRKNEAQQLIKISGDKKLGEHIFSMLAIMG